MSIATNPGLMAMMRDFFAVLCLQAGIPESQIGVSITPEIRRKKSMPVGHIAQVCNGISPEPMRVNAHAWPEEHLEAAMAGNERRYSFNGSQLVNLEHGGVDPANAIRVGDFPGLFAAWANKMVDVSMQKARLNCELWTGLAEPSTKLNQLAPITSISGPNRLDEATDGSQIPVAKLHEETIGAERTARYSNLIGMGPRAFANDGLAGIRGRIEALVFAGYRTLDEIAIARLVDPRPLLDGTALFDAARGNVVSALAGPPSLTQWDSMVQLNRAQVTPAGHRLPDTLSIALVPGELETSSRSAFNPATFGAITIPGPNGEPVQRGVTVVVEPELSNYSAKEWYGLTDPEMGAVIVRRWFDGWTKEGRREFWFDINTGVWNFSLELRAGFAPVNFRYGVKNNGQ